MLKGAKFSRTAAVAVILTGVLAGVPQFSFAAPRMSAAAESNSSVLDAVSSKLDKKQFKNVKATADNDGIVTLTGTVDLFEYKMDAQRRAQKAKGVNGIRNQIQVSGPTVPDQELQGKLVEKLQYDRVGYGNLFNAIAVNVQNGVVTLSGHARTDVDKDSALALVSTYPGVKEVDDEIQVDPVSLMDDQTRLAVARAVYGYPSLNKYAIDPAKPIRISVQSGHVELSGVVDSKADKDTAFIRANGVPGVFSVQNNLQVANQSDERSQK